MFYRKATTMRKITLDMALGDYLEERSTIRTMASPPIPANKAGNDGKFIAKKGDTVIATGTGAYRAGTKIKVVIAYHESGYNYYRDTANVVHRTRDIQVKG
jgi:hypothetical protein